MTDLPALAAKLSEAQRAAILFIGDAARPYDGVPLFGTYWDRPENKGLLAVIRTELKLTSCEWQPGVQSPIERLTPLGLALREHIMEEQND